MKNSKTNPLVQQDIQISKGNSTDRRFEQYQDFTGHLRSRENKKVKKLLKTPISAHQFRLERKLRENRRSQGFTLTLNTMLTEAEKLMMMAIIILMGMIFRWAKRNVRRISETRKKNFTLKNGIMMHWSYQTKMFGTTITYE